MTHTQVLELDIVDQKVLGLTIEKAGVKQPLQCKKEVILCAGTILSPRILMASGIGNKEELRQLGIDCHHHVPGVGENLQDHIDSMVTVRSSKADSMGVSFKTLLPHVLPAPFKYFLGRKGWWTTNYVEAGGFAKTTLAIDADTDPDIQFHFAPLYRSHRGKKFEWGHGYSVFTCVLRPISRGSVKLANDGSKRNVLIDYNFFAHEQDQQTLVEGGEKSS